MRACAACGADGAVVRDRDREATRGTVAARAERLPVVVCPAGHREPAPLAAAAREAVIEGLPHAVRPVLRRHDRCRRCQGTLTMPVRRTERAVTLVAGDDVPVTTLRFDLPTTRCPDCGVDQVPHRSQRDLTAVVEALFAPSPPPPPGPSPPDLSPSS